MHVKHLNTIKPKGEANNAGILLAFILRKKFVSFLFFIVSGIFFLNPKKPHLLIHSYISQARRFKIPICGLSVSRKGQLRVLRLSTGKEKNFTWWEVEE